MSSTIKLKRSDVPSKVPTPDQLSLGEVAINTSDGRMFMKRDDGTIEEVVEVTPPKVIDGGTAFD